MYKFINQDDIKDSNVIECKKIDNDIIFVKQNVLEDDLVRVDENQCIIMVENGRILDIKKEPDLYAIKNVEKAEISEDLKNLIIRDSENQCLCVIFFNMNVIKRNRLILSKVKVNKKNISLEVMFDFKISNPLSMLSKMIGLRNRFTRAELIEKIREFFINYIKNGINETLEEYELNSLTDDFTIVENIFNKEKQDEKLLEYGIEVFNFRINEFKVLERKFNFF